jgi:organic hydroperoxide reductase OsmC/OhrA
MATSSFPHQYAVDLVCEGSRTPVLRAGERPPIEGGAPPEFGGSPLWWGPEHLLLASVALCSLTTFQAFARLQGLAVQAYSSAIKGTLDKTPGGLGFTQIRLAITVGVAEEDIVRAEALLARVKKHCIIANSLNVPVDFDLLVLASGLEAAVGSH